MRSFSENEFITIPTHNPVDYAVFSQFWYDDNTAERLAAEALEASGGGRCVC